MRITFWGTRGSLARPGADTLRYGGNTSCVQIQTAAGTLVVLDAGTGVHDLGQRLTAKDGAPLEGHVLISHTHWDHIQGLPFFRPLFVPGNRWDIYGPRGLGNSLRGALAGQMQYTYFPVTLAALGADVRYHDLVEGTFQLAEIRARTQYLNHPALTLGYRLEVDGVTVVYACDHEPHARDLAVEPGKLSRQDQAHADFLRGADLVIHDAQYTRGEYPTKVGWGHSTAEYAVRVCRAVGVKRLALTHHDPLHDDDMIDRSMESLRKELDDGGPAIEVFAAAEGQVIELTGDAGVTDDSAADESARRPRALGRQRMLVGVGHSENALLIREAAEADDIEMLDCDARSVVERYRDQHPPLVMLDDDEAGLAACRSIRALGGEQAEEVPIILVGPKADRQTDATEGLRSPFSVEYARSRIRSWLLRVECRWMPPPIPDDEEERLAALHRLRLLDTAPEERFDRLTRLAAGLLGAPIALLTLVDEDRQWFKSVVGGSISETSRDLSFCGHAIMDGNALIIPDALQDDRFADNPVVSGPPHIRFYAGCPLSLADGHRVGALCVNDVRPRELSEEQIRLLRDLADLAEEELARSGG